MVRQAKSFLVLMDNYDRALEATAMGYNSAGSAAKEFGKWQDSIEGKTNNLKSALEQFSTKTLNSDFVKNVVDVSTAFVKMGTSAGGAAPLIFALGTAIATVNILNKTALLTNLVSQFSSLSKIVTVTSAGITGLSTAGTLLVGGGIIVGIIAIAYALERLNGAADRAKEAVNTLSTELSDMQENSKTVESLGRQYEELGKKTKLSAEEQENFTDIQNQLRELLPEVNGYYDTQGNFIIDENENLGSLNKTYAEYIALKREELALASKESASFTVKGYKTETNKVNSLKEYLKLAQKSESGTLDTTDIDQVNYLQSMLGIDFTPEAINKAISESQKTISASLIEMQSDIKNQVMNSPEWKKLGTDTQNGILKAFSEMSSDTLPLLSEAMVNGDVSTQEFIDTLSKTEAFKNFIENVKNATNETTELGDEIQALSDILSKFENSQSVINSVKESVNESGKLNLDNIQQLIETYPQLESVLYDYLAGLATTSEVMSEVDKAYLVDENNYKDAVATKQQYNEEFYNNTANLGGKLVKAFNDSYGIDLSNCKNLAEAKIKVEQETVKSIATLWQRYYDSQKQDFNSAFYNKMPQEYDTRASRELSNTLYAYKDLVDTRITALDNIVYEGITLPAISGSSSSGGKSTAQTAEDLAQEQADAIIAAYEKANREIERKLTQLDLSQRLTTENSAEYIAIEKEKYNAIIAQETLLQQKIAELQKLGTEVATEEAENLIDVYYNLMNERYSIIENLQSITVTNLESQKEAIESIHEYTMDMIKAELEAKKESYQEEMDDIEKIFNAKKQALQDEKDSRDYDKGLTDKTSNIADLENQLALIKNDETAIAKRKALEEELAKAKEDLTDYQYDHSIDLQENALDTELELQKEALQEKIDKLDDTLNNEVKMRELADKRIQKSGEKLYTQLIDYAEEYGEVTREEISDAWENATTSINGYKTSQEDLLGTLKLVTAELAKIENGNLDSYASDKGLSTMSFTEAKSKMIANSSAWTNAKSDAERKDLHDANVKIGNSMGWTYDEKTGRWYYFDEKGKKVPVYHVGGIVGGYSTKSTEELALLAKKELVITPPQAQNIMDNITNNSNSNITLSMPVYIEGNADGDTVKAIEKQIDKLADKVITKLNTARNNTGFKKKPKFV